MSNKTLTHNFKYSKEEIEGLIKADIARQLGMQTIPIINYSIEFDIRYSLQNLTSFVGVNAKVEVPG